MAKRTKIFPVPEVIEKGPWTVREGNGMVQIGSRRIQTPFKDDSESEFIRAHELGHIKWSPDPVPELKDIDPSIMQLVEDCRINRKLVNTGVPAELGRPLQDYEIEALNNHDPAHKIGYLLATKELDMFEDDPRVEISPKLRKAAEVFYEDMKSSSMDWSDTERISKQITSLFGDGVDEEEAEKIRSEDVDDVIKHDLDEEAFDRDESYYETKENEWGDMTVNELSMPIRLKSDLLTQSLKKRCSEYGIVPNRMDRFCTDGKIFQSSRRKRNLGGTLLIDVSGSMHLSESDIERILEKLPLAKIAMYSGHDESGELSIIADDGKRVDPEDFKVHYAAKGGGNVVDGPALLWVNKQAQPRIWICDGVVTGKHDCAARNLDIEASALQKRGKVKRIDNLDELAEVDKSRL